MFCLLVVLAKLSLLAKWLARKTPLRKPNRGEGIISIKLRPKSVHDFLSLLYCFIVLLCICVVSCPYMIYRPTVMARYSLFVLKVPLNPKQTNKQNQTGHVAYCCVVWQLAYCVVQFIEKDVTLSEPVWFFYLAPILLLFLLYYFLFIGQLLRIDAYNTDSCWHYSCWFFCRKLCKYR